MASCRQKKTVKVNGYHVLLSDSTCSGSFCLLYHVVLHSFGQYLKKKGKCYISKLLCSHFTCQGPEWYTSKLVWLKSKSGIIESDSVKTRRGLRNCLVQSFHVIDGKREVQREQTTHIAGGHLKAFSLLPAHSNLPFLIRNPHFKAQQPAGWVLWAVVNKVV